MGSIRQIRDCTQCGHARVWGGSLVVPSSISVWGALEDKKFSSRGASANQRILARQTLHWVSDPGFH